MLELIGLREDLVERTCLRILENRQGNDLASTAVVFPSKRFGFFLRRELAAAMEGDFFPPALFPVETFFEALFKLNFPGRRILAELEAAHAVYESVVAVFRDGMYGSRTIADFATFHPWATKVLAALDEILNEGGQTSGIDLATYENFTGLGDYHRSYKDFIGKIPELLADLEQRLDGRRQTTMALACRMVAGLAETGELATPPAQAWIFSGFNAMNACERKLFRFFEDRSAARLILRTDPEGMADPLAPFHLQSETIRSLGMAPPAAPPPADRWDDLAAKVTIQPCDGVESEVYHAYARLEEICRGRDEAALRKVAVLLPSPSTLIPFVQGAVSRFDQSAPGVPFNITLGYPLERTPVMQLVDSMLTLLENTVDGVMAAGDYLQLIRHPYVKISGDGGREPLKRGIHLLEDVIGRQNLARFSVPELREKLAVALIGTREGLEPGLAAEIVAQVDRVHERFLPRAFTDMPALLAFLRRALESVGSEKNRSAHLFLNEYAAASLDALEELEDFIAAHEKAFHAADAAALAALVRSHFRGRTIRFEGSPLQGVQVMGPLEFRGLSFEHVIVLDALEGILPGTAKYDPILPADIRAIFGIRDHGDWERIYAFNFFAMLGAAGNVHILYPRKSEDGQERERSRFIERIAYAVEKRTGRAPAAVPVPLPFAIVPRETKQVKKGPAVRERLRALTLSPSSLETYVQCPLQFYYRRVLGLKEREEVASETEGGLIGTIVHEALQVFYSKFPAAAPLSRAGQGALDAELERCLFSAFRKFHFEPEKGLERIRAWTLLEQLRRFVGADRERIAANNIQVRMREEKLAMELLVHGLEHPVRIEGRLDRWEAEGGLLRVVDYKTGAPFNPKVRLPGAPECKGLHRRQGQDYLAALNAFRTRYPGMQLLVYLMLLARDKGKGWEGYDAAYVFLREKGNKMIQGIFVTSGSRPREFSSAEKQAAMDAFAADLSEVLRDLFAREYFLPNPADERTCAYCPFRLPCGNL